MLAAVLPWPNFVVGVGVIIVTSMAVGLAGWVALLRSSIPLPGIKDAEAAKAPKAPNAFELQEAPEAPETPHAR